MDKNKSFIKETKSELKKVIWPTRQEVINGTGVVVVMVVVVGLIILAFDFASSWAIEKIINLDFTSSKTSTSVVEEVDETAEDTTGEIIETVETVEGETTAEVAENSVSEE